MKKMNAFALTLGFAMSSLGFSQLAAQEVASPTGPDGIWQSQGYGRIMEIQNGQYRIREVTQVSCLDGSSGSMSDFTIKLDPGHDRMAILEGFDAYGFRRIGQLPQICLSPDANAASEDPRRNFEVFAQTIEEHFAYFDLAAVRWPELRASLRARLTAESTPAELLMVMEEALEALNDGHGEVSPSEGAIEEAPNASEPLQAAAQTEKDYGDFEIAGLVAAHHLETDMTKNSPLIKWGLLSDRTGYLQINIMTLYARFPELQERIDREGFMSVYLQQIDIMTSAERLERETAGIAAVMDRAMRDLAGMDRIVLDLRFNGGGFDEVGLEALKRFNDKRRLIASKIACTQAGCTRPLPIHLDSSDDAYTKPVLLLVSPQTGSAAEMFTLSAQALPNVTIAGSATMGAISDAFERTLPNGWTFTISNEEYFDTQMRSFETRGVPVAKELSYPRGRQAFFRGVARDLSADKAAIMALLDEMHPSSVGALPETSG
ncbi:MAG: S41 family peptidase [Pseudomonadota bacterium]